MSMSLLAPPDAGPPGPIVNPFAPTWIANPYPMYAQLRAQGPSFFAPGGLWVLARYADVDLLTRDPRFVKRNGVALQNAFGTGPLQDSVSHWMLVLDPPDHTRLRSLVSQAFTPRAIERLRQQIQHVVDDLLDGFATTRRMDLIADFAYPLPVQVICSLLGVPAEDQRPFRQWSAAVAASLDAVVNRDPELIRGGNAGAEGLTEYFRELVAIRRSDPQDDLLSVLIAAEEYGDRLSEDELLGTSVLLFLAGHETTTNLIGNGMLALLCHPDQVEKLRDDPSLIRTAVEELLRYDSPIQRSGIRFASEDVELDSAVIRRGEMATGFIGASNRDPDQFLDPDDLDVGRLNNRHLSFAAGSHYCLGAALARLEAQIAFATLVEHFPNLDLLIDEPVWRQTAQLRGLQSLPVGF